MRTAHASPFEELVQRVRTDYIDTPSLRLTPSQAQRRFGMAPSASVAVLDALLAENFLSSTSDGLFVRRHPPNSRAVQTAEAHSPVHGIAVPPFERRVPGFTEAAREALARVIRFAGWLPHDTIPFRVLHDAVRALEAATSSLALRDALYAVELSEQPLPHSAILTLLRQSTGELHDQYEASGMYAADQPRHN
jgi:hypothetical protein